MDMCKKTFDFFYRITVEIWSHFTPLQWRPHNPKKHPRPTYNTVPTTETIHELILYALSDGRWRCEKLHSEHRNGGAPSVTMPEVVIWQLFKIVWRKERPGNGVTSATKIYGTRYNLIWPKSMQRYVEYLVPKTVQKWRFWHIQRPPEVGKSANFDFLRIPYTRQFLI